MSSARDANSLHPLWSESVPSEIPAHSGVNSLRRYVFPRDVVDGVIDLTSDERPFYFNPYSGELSLEFQKAEKNCKGGILA
jgi:DNA repair protein RAD5